VSNLSPLPQLTPFQTPDGTKGVKVGTVIAVIGEEGDDFSGAAEVAKQAASQVQQADAKEEKPKEDVSKPSSPEPPKPEPSDAAKEELPKGDRIFATPIAKKIALERGIPLAKIRGTGPGGRIVREDVEKYQAPAAASSGIPSSAPPPAAQLAADYTDTPISNMRRTIGSRLTQSKQELPHYYLTLDITMDKTLKLREVFNKTLAEKDLKLSVNDFIVKAAACALADVPEANSAWLGEVIRT
jgi:pyruvate dehydrogenase E2 component (dihydrolipoamide acetyltransferase)